MKKEFKFGTDLDGKAKEELIRLAYEGKERSYSPYSGFQVGAVRKGVKKENFVRLVEYAVR